MQTIIVRHKVGDIDAWLAGHQDRVDIFGPLSTGFRTFQDMNDPHSVVLVIETDDLEALAKAINDPVHDEAKARHTVLEPIIVSTEINP